ncbi:MAG: hypothetical protein P1V19_05000 [Gimesia sp.]|nr:hypothetical protein [Gimesia sp.]
MEKIDNLDLGIGPIINFGPSRYQASNQVWGTVLDKEANYKELEMQSFLRVWDQGFCNLV